MYLNANQALKGLKSDLLFIRGICYITQHQDPMWDIEA
jgi:hypothetical protein